MKLDLMESGLQNIREIAKQYEKAIIYFHIDLDGVTSAIAAKAYLAQYGIETIDVQKIQYGSIEYAIRKPLDKGILPVLVDFSHGKSFMKIHTDHHDSQIAYQGTSQQFRHSKSNAGTISSIISTHNIFPTEDTRIIDMIDSAGYKDEGINPWDMVVATVKADKSKSTRDNHMRMGMACGKLLLAYKNKPDFLETIVMKSQPSLQSMYNVMLGIIKEHLQNGDRGWVSPEKIEANSQAYYDQQKAGKIKEGTVDDIKDMTNGQTALIGDVIFQIGGGNMSKTGSYDRYTAFRLYPNAKYFIMLWHTIGMMQVSVNPWGEKQDIHLGHIVLDDIFKKKYAPLLRKRYYDIPLLAIKKLNEKDVTSDNEQEALGFNYEEFSSLFDDVFSKVKLSDKQQYTIEKFMNMKPSEFVAGDDKKKAMVAEKAIKFLSNFYIPLPDIVEKLSGGHPAITNLTGFNFLDEKQKLEKTIKSGKNPYEVEASGGRLSSYKKGDSTSTKILKSIAQDVVKVLNKKDSK